MIVASIATAACTYAPIAPQSATADIAELWQEPTDLLERDLLNGPGGAALRPQQNSSFAFVAFKTTGTNPGYEVKDATGRTWSVKLGVEAQSEVTAARILWAMGFPQPPSYFVHQFTLTGIDDGVKTTARFRTDSVRWRSISEWSWYDNPFVNTQPFRGLIVAQLVLNNWDLKTPNNRVYEAIDPSVVPRRQYMVRDVGASLGSAKQFRLFTMLGTRGAQGSKNDLEDFERQGFIERVEGDKVVFDYRGPNQGLVDTITVADVIWACELLAKIPDGHWQAAFKAGAYQQADADRYIAKIKAKIAQGLALRNPATR
ncbi:MAG TPA: hypothetical protein VM096_02825 [Vicinamibacterales bacterium]|nr:hypothetical protein [Vicinamibacterales bacterium]